MNTERKIEGEDHLEGKRSRRLRMRQNATKPFRLQPSPGRWNCAHRQCNEAPYLSRLAGLKSQKTDATAAPPGAFPCANERSDRGDQTKLSSKD